MKRRLQADISSMARKKRISLGISSMWGIEMMMEVIPQFRERYPEVTLELRKGSFSDLSTGYFQGKYDILVTSAVSENVLPGVCIPLRMEELKLIISASDPFALRHWNQSVLQRSVIRDELANADAIRHDLGTSNYDVENQLFDELGTQARTICQLGDDDALKRLVSSGLGYALVSENVVGKDSRIIRQKLLRMIFIRRSFLSFLRTDSILRL